LVHTFKVGTLIGTRFRMGGLVEAYIGTSVSGILRK
jgi:hypothetical protein